MSPSPQRWLRHYRQYHDMTIDALATDAGLSKVFVGKLERGERSPSPESKQALADALGELVGDVFPTDGRMSPEDAAEYYVESIRTKKHSAASEDEFDLDMRAHGLDPDEEAGSDVAYFPDEDSVVIDFSRMDESVHAVRVQVAPVRITHKIPRPGNTRARRSGAQRKRKASSSTSDDPGESEPAGSRRHLEDFADLHSWSDEGELERASVVGSPASRAARSQGAD